MAEMVQLITQRGPKIDEISRAIGVPSETVRYRYRQLLARGFTIQASCNYESLGMKRVVAVIELGDLFKDSADMTFYLMNQFAFVGGYARTKQGDRFVVSSSVPRECLAPWADLMLELRDAGVLKSIESITLDWVRNVPMRAECFDFGSGRWRPDWKTGRGPPVLEEKHATRQEYDTTDIKIIGQLQIDANSSLRSMCERVGSRNYKTFTWHYREHVLRRNLIKGYRVNWTGTKYGRTGGLSSDGNGWVDVVADGLTESERTQLAAVLSKVPFVWLEGSGARSYYARMVFPVQYAARLNGLLETALAPVGNRAKLLPMDARQALHFSLTAQNYDEESQEWRLNKEEMLQSFHSLETARREPVPAGRNPSPGG
jgi:hypothetical protein